MAAIIVLAVLAFLLFVLAFSCIKIVRPYQRGLVERLGQYKGTVDPGLRIIMPFIDRVRLVDMREQVVDVPPQEVITSDNVVVSVDAVVYYEATDPQRLVYNVANFMLAVTKLAQTNLRNLIGDMQLDEALTSRDTINTHLREILDDATDKWGVRVVRVEIQRIDPPPDVMQSMHEQMQAERTRRAVVTEARASARPPSPGPRARSRRRSSRPRAQCRAQIPTPSWPTPRSTASRRSPRARPRPSGRCTPPSTTATRRPTCSPSSTSRRCGRWPTARPPRSSCPPR